MKKCLKASLLCLLLYSNIYTYMFEKPFNWNRKKIPIVHKYYYYYTILTVFFASSLLVSSSNIKTPLLKKIPILLFSYFFSIFLPLSLTLNTHLPSDLKKNACESKIRPKHFPRKITAIIMGIHKSPFLFLQCLKITKKIIVKNPKTIFKKLFQVSRKKCDNSPFRKSVFIPFFQTLCLLVVISLK